MDDYPTNLMEFDRRFDSEQACRDYLAQMKWPEGFRCPRCDNRQAWLTARKLYHCTACGHETSLTAGTIFQDTRKPLTIVPFRQSMCIHSGRISGMASTKVKVNGSILKMNSRNLFYQNRGLDT